MILLDIPQGVVTIGAALLASGITVSGTFAIAAVGVALSFQRRLTALEAEVKELRNDYRSSRFPYWGNTDPPGNPMLQERWDELTKKLDLEMLSDDEAQELHTAFIQRHKQAKEENDRETVAILAGAMSATELQIHLAEIRNTSWWHTLLIMLGLKPTHNQIWEAERKRRKKAEQISDLSLGNFSPAASMPKERWNELCQKLELDDLSDGEARELHDAVIQRHKQAREENEAAAMESLGTAKIFTEFRIRDVTRKRREKK